MKNIRLSFLSLLGALAGLFPSGRADAAPFTAGNIAVLRAGDGAAALSGAATAVFIDEYTPAGVPAQSIAIPAAAGATQLTLSGTATSEGGLMRSPNGAVLCFAGYKAAAGLGAVVATTAAANPRQVGIVDLSGTFTVAASTSTQFSASNIRSGATDGANNFWGGGNGTPAAISGINYFGTASAAAQLLAGNLRWANIFNGDLYFSSGSTTPGTGIHQFTGSPVAPAVSTPLTVVAGQSPYGFSINPAGTAMYVADDRATTSGGGIQRWNKAAGVWSLAYTLGTTTGAASTAGTRGLAVNWSGAAPVIYATTTETTNNRLISVSDSGAAPVTTLVASAGANKVFRGVAFAPEELRTRKPRFYTSGALPPANGVYVSAPGAQAAYPNGISIRNVSHRAFSASMPPPALGVAQSLSLSLTSEMDISNDGGATWQHYSAPAAATMRFNHVSDNGPTSTFDTEMLQLDITGGGLPAGVLVRESPTRTSIGRTTSTLTGGGFMIDSFFDVFTELSVDGGATWSPSGPSLLVELTVDPRQIAPVPAPTSLYPPPNDFYASPGQFLSFPGGIFVRNARHHFFAPALPFPELIGASQVQTLDGQMDMEVSADGGATYNYVRVPAAASVRITHIRDEGSIAIFDTEMLQLSLSGGGLPAGVMSRESPTRQSPGGTAIAPQTDGTFRVHSFFDVFAELSLDGGQTWVPAPAPGHLELQCSAPEVPESSPNLPPLPGQYASNSPLDAVFSGGYALKGTQLSRFTQSTPPPPPGASQVHQSGAEVQLQLSADGGLSFQSFTAPAQVTFQVSSSVDSGATRFFDTEMLALNISGGNLPVGVMVRESPSKASLGRTSLRTLPGPAYLISSFFDVFTELSLDGGQTWLPTTVAPFELTLQTTDPDSDHDGLPDLWELANFGDLASGPTGDNDRDGSTNGYEYLAGTSPIDPASVLRPESKVSGLDLKIIFPTLNGHQYAIESSTDLTPTSWTVVVSGIEGDGTTRSILLTNGFSSLRRYYRVIPSLTQ